MQVIASQPFDNERITSQIIRRLGEDLTPCGSAACACTSAVMCIPPFNDFSPVLGQKRQIRPHFYKIQADFGVMRSILIVVSLCIQTK